MQPHTVAHTSLPYTIIPIDAAFVQRVQGQGVDDLAQAVEHHVASGGEPCRDVLRHATPGERILLASYCPFTVAGPYKEFGPVFVMADAAPPTVAPTSLAELGATGYLGEQFVLRAYSSDERIVDASVVTREQADAALQALLHRADVQFVLVRFAAYGCYACRIERV